MLVLPPEDGSVDLHGCTLEVTVEDVGRADAAAHVVAVVRRDFGDVPRDGLRLGPFDVEVAPPPARDEWTVRGAVRHDDTLLYLTTQHVPMRVPGDVDVPLSKVAGQHRSERTT